MNRRMGGGHRGNNRPSSFSQQPFQSGGVNPWQGGGGSNPNQGGILSQLTSNPQLALALTSLLQPQQQQPPSLLSLNTSPAFSSNRDYGRFGGISRGRDIRRHEPYNKNRGGFGDRRRRSPGRGKKNDDKKKNEKKNEKKIKEENADATTQEDDEKESKRDWKDEKNQAEGNTEDDGEKKEGDAKDGKYGGVPRKYLNCFVCNKQMWDGESMSKHVRGRAHHEMLKALEESIHICVSILRENLRLSEERKLIEYNRQSRQRKFNQRREPQLSHCAMCDLKFMGKIISHRRTDGHQRLKRYLHPTCRICDKEYPSRIEWVEHCLTPEHLKRSNVNTESRIGGKDGDEIIEDIEEPEQTEELDLEPLLNEALEMEGEDPILEPDSNLDNMVNRLPAYKRNRPVATQCLTEFSGWRCDLCNRSFAEKEDADSHLTTKRHFYRFVESIKDRFEREEKRKKAEREAAEKKKKEDAENETKEENGVKEEGGEEGEDAEMYDPAETTEEDKANGEAEDPEQGENKMDTSAVEEEEEEEEKKEEEVKQEPPATPKPNTRKVGGPKSKRGKK